MDGGGSPTNTDTKDLGISFFLMWSWSCRQELTRVWTRRGTATLHHGEDWEERERSGNEGRKGDDSESATRVHVRGPGCLLFGRLEARLAQEVV